MCHPAERHLGMDGTVCAVGLCSKNGTLLSFYSLIPYDSPKSGLVHYWAKNYLKRDVRYIGEELFTVTCKIKGLIQKMRLYESLSTGRIKAIVPVSSLPGNPKRDTVIQKKSC